MKICKFLCPRYFFVLVLLCAISVPSECHGRRWRFFKDDNLLVRRGESDCQLTDREMQAMLSSANRVICDMSGMGNNCGFYAILSQTKAENFGGEALSPSGHAHGDANAYVKALRQKTGTPVGEMFDAINIQKIADYYRRPVVIISYDSGQIEFVFPYGDVYAVLTRLNFKENFGKWLEEYLAMRSDELPKILDALQRFATDIDVRGGTVYDVLIGLLRNQKTIGMLHENGNHFLALQPDDTK